MSSAAKVTFGHSVGGMLAVAAAEHDPRIQAVDLPDLAGNGSAAGLVALLGMAVDSGECSVACRSGMYR